MVRIYIRLVVITGVMACCALPASGQHTSERVYQILQTSCTFSGCHDNDSPVLGLDLEGSGPNAMMDVYDNLVGVSPVNAHAAAQGYKYIVPGRPDRSFLFRKVNNGLDPLLALHPNEGDPMPQGLGALAETDIELIRQWILYGAPATGEVIDVALIDGFYNNNGVESVPSPPASPAPGEGFQIHLGPFFIEPGGEEEVFLKYDPFLEEGLEVTAAEVFMGSQSHHFILYRFFGEGETFCGSDPGTGAADYSEGYRGVDEASHFSALFQLGAQFPERVDLPYNTAFSWNQDAVLDLNSHYINTSPTGVLSADVYINLYTQPQGTAAQEMKAIMLPKTDFTIPNDGEVHTFTENLPVGLCYPDGLYVWAMTSHTHQLGQDYDIFRTNAAGAELEHLYDASCALTDGVPGCATSFYDYQHPPTRVFDDYYHLTGADWLKHRASYINNGPAPVTFGFTSEDEMMLFFMFYVEDTAGLSPPVNALPVAVNDEASTEAGIAVNIPVLDNDADADGALDPASVVIVQDPVHGSALVNGDGSVTYTPAGGFEGTDSLAYVVCDDTGPPACDTAWAFITVESALGLYGPAYIAASVFPNPVTGKLFLNGVPGPVAEVRLLGMDGKQYGAVPHREEASGISVDLTRRQLRAGLYFLQISFVDGSLARARFVYSPGN